jgi:hypothetical protein
MIVQTPEPMTKNKRNKPLNYVTVSSSSYGSILKGTKIYYEGKRPKQLAKDGTISFGKNILEILRAKFHRFRWIITSEEDSIRIDRGIHRVRTSVKLIARMNNSLFGRKREIKIEIIRNKFAIAYPAEFRLDDTTPFVPGSVARVLVPGIVAKLSSEDKEAIRAILPDFISSESLSSVNLLKAEAQIESLKELVHYITKEIEVSHGESWWQSFIKSNILLIQQGYIKTIPKMNLGLVETKFPDFTLVTHDGYLDILEIKKPATSLLKFDSSHKNYYWDAEISRAIIQVENYIENLSRFRDPVRSYLQDTYKIILTAVRPRGIILAGDRRQFAEQKQKDDFRLLSQGLKNICVLTYDELLINLNNYIEALEEFRKLKK